jgi:hypothetical protein
MLISKQLLTINNNIDILLLALVLTLHCTSLLQNNKRAKVILFFKKWPLATNGIPIPITQALV